MIRRRAFWTKAILLGLSLNSPVVFADSIKSDPLPTQSAAPGATNSLTDPAPVAPQDVSSELFPDAPPSDDVDPVPGPRAGAPLGNQPDSLPLSSTFASHRLAETAPLSPLAPSAAGRDDSLVTKATQPSKSLPANSSIPEPASVILVVTGLVGLAARRRLRRAMTSQAKPLAHTSAT